MNGELEDEAFKLGKRCYAEGKPMPRRPDEEDAFSVSSWLWCGWMIGRANDVGRIFEVLDACGIRHTPQGEEICGQLVRALNRKLNFTPME